MNFTSSLSALSLSIIFIISHLYWLSFYCVTNYYKRSSFHHTVLSQLFGIGVLAWLGALMRGVKCSNEGVLQPGFSPGGVARESACRLTPVGRADFLQQSG